MMMLNFEALVETAKDAARMAGNAILEVYNSDDFDVETKGDASPLTKADKRAHEVIVESLSITNLPILSEEGRDIPYNERKSWEYFWMVDPLDGTKEFIKRNGEFTVNIALIRDQKPVLGVVFAPVLDKLFFAVKEKGAKIVVKSEVNSIRVPEFSFDDSGLKVVASRSHLNDTTKDFLDGLKDPEIVSMGSSLKFLTLAEGNAHLYPRYAPTMEWDTAAAQIILEEAGGRVLQEGTDKKVVYNKENLLNPHFLAMGFLVSEP